MTSATVRGKLMAGSGGRVRKATNRSAVSRTGAMPLFFDSPEPFVQSSVPMRQLVGGAASLGPYSPRIDNLLSMSLCRDLECVQQLADLVLDRLIMIFQRAAVLEGERGMGFRQARLGQDRLEHLVAHDPHRGHRPQP